MTDIAAYLDEDNRTRGRINRLLRDTLFVEAGAGTGKTRALVERVLAHILDGTPVERIVAITFTEKAAAELRERVRRSLEDRAGSAEGADTDRIAAALASLDRAQISTIHSFAQSLLYSYAAEAGVDPGFRVQDEVLAVRRKEEQWRLYLEAIAEDAGARRAIDRVLSLGLNTTDIQALAMGLAARGELIALLENRPIATPAPLWPDFNALLAEMESLPLDVPAPDDPLLKKVLPVLDTVRDLVGASDREAALTAAAWFNLGVKVSNQAAWGGAENIMRVRETTHSIGSQLVELLENVRAEALAQLMPYILQFARADAIARGRGGHMTFDDLILLVRDLLYRNPGAVEALRATYDVLLIDEFQDTDPLQVDIAIAFATEPATGVAQPGRLFLVGDPKQSIYRFRRADMAIYSATQDAVESQGGRREVLALNRRSRKVIVDWVNAVFEGLIGTGEAPDVQPRYEAIHAERDSQLKGPGVAVYGEMLDGPNTREVRQLDALVTAALCRKAHEDGWEVEDRDTRRVRRVQYRDIALLIPTRNILLALERALADAGVPYRIEGGSLVYRTQEIRDVINILTAIDDPYDEIAIVAALRSPAFACSDVDLARFKVDNRGFNYMVHTLDGQSGRVAEALRKLAEYHRTSHLRSLSALVEDAITDAALIEVGVLDRADRNSFRRMRFIIEQARSFEAERPESLRAFVSWLESRAEATTIRDHEGTTLDDDEDAVRVLTIHGAKGLEFPVVFLCGLGSAPYFRPEMYVADHTAGTVAVRAGALNRGARFCAGPVNELHDREREHEAAEYRRVLYVGATRARDHLAVSLFHSKNAKQSGASLLMNGGATEGARLLYVGEFPQQQTASSLEALTVDSEGVDGFAQARAALVEGAAGPRYTSATALRDSKTASEDDTEPWSRGRGGTRLGRAVHAAIQSLDLAAGPAEIAAFAKAQAVAEAIPHREETVADLVSRALDSEAARRARQARQVMREVPFACRLESGVIEGFVDLLIRTDEGLEIVDWKTDQIAAQEVPERMEEYELQAGLYALGISRATSLPVSRITYVFVSAGVERSPGTDLAALMERAEKQIAEVASGRRLTLLNE